MSTIILILLALIVITSVALILGEIFYFPGFGLPGILGAIGLIGVFFYLFSVGAPTLMIGSLVLATILFVIGFYVLSKSTLMKGVSLTSEIEDKVNKLPQDLFVGAKGTAKSRMALTGRIEINGRFFEATSEQGFILEDTPIYISHLTQDKILVSIDKETLQDN